MKTLSIPSSVFPGGDAHLGGDDWDAAIVTWLQQTYLEPAGEHLHLLCYVTAEQCLLPVCLTTA